MKNNNNISVKSSRTGKENFYSTYCNAMNKAKSGDTVIVYADPCGQIIIKNDIRLIFNNGVIVKRAEKDIPLIFIV
ncbi:MAG: hypothetical protein R3A12_09755 [Ignavibacteria bacterium]